MQLFDWIWWKSPRKSIIVFCAINNEQSIWLIVIFPPREMRENGWKGLQQCFHSHICVHRRSQETPWNYCQQRVVDFQCIWMHGHSRNDKRQNVNASSLSLSKSMFWNTMSDAIAKAMSTLANNVQWQACAMCVFLFKSTSATYSRLFFLSLSLSSFRLILLLVIVLFRQQSLYLSFNI